MRRGLPPSVLVMLEGVVEGRKNSLAEGDRGLGGYGEVVEEVCGMVDDVAGVTCDDGLGLR